jgi:farnesyl diphosphate synthase
MDFSSLKQCLSTYRERVRVALGARLPAATMEPRRLHEAMRYAVLNGGKRVRAVLVYAAGNTLGAPLARLDAPACAVEMIHAYSLVHDDLPAMDNDDLRRGQPTCHRAFDEATALLAGDALQALAYEVLVTEKPGLPENRCADMVRTLAGASGSLGMAGGQAIDLDAVGTPMSLQALENMHRHKTGALIRASVRLGALSSDAEDAERTEALDTYASAVGLAFQIRDDVLDIEGDTATIGKKSGADLALNKPTYPAVIGIEAAKLKAQELHTEALRCLESFGTEADPLRWLSEFIVNRPS